MTYLKKTDTLESYSAVVSSPSYSIQVPAVIRLRSLVAKVKMDVKFSRNNVYTRDQERCQYCGKKFPRKMLNYDHVVPRAKGGKTNWTNIVTACIKCNLKKDCRTPEEAGMVLLSRPVRPKSLPLNSTFIPTNDVPDLWKPYLGVEG